MMLTDLATVLRAGGLKVQEVADWQTRGHGSMVAVDAIICHHTAGAKTGNYPSMAVVRDGRPGLDGPLAQLGLARDGTWLVIAAGLCWHAGVVFETWQGNSHAIGVEAEGTGVDPWPQVQYDSYARGVRVLADHYSVPNARVLGHKEVAKPKGRKNDPNFDMNEFRADVARGTQPPDLGGLTVADVQDILAYQKACTIQVQNNTRQLLNNAVNTLLDGMQKYAVAVNDFTRQTDSGSDAERTAALNKLRDDLMASLKPLQDAAADVPEPPK